jgi:hypothetical protein
LLGVAIVIIAALTSRYLNATTQGVKQAFKKLEAKRRRRSLKVVRGPHVARG